jgi:hypothetical protein
MNTKSMHHLKDHKVYFYSPNLEPEIKTEANLTQTQPSSDKDTAGQVARLGRFARSDICQFLAL